MPDKKSGNNKCQYIRYRGRPQEIVPPEEDRKNNRQRHAENDLTGHGNRGRSKCLAQCLQVDKGALIQSRKRHQIEINAEAFHGKVRIIGALVSRTEWHPLPMFEATPENCEAFRRWLDSQWAELPEALPTQTAARLIGNNPQRIHELIREETLHGIKIGPVQYCAKEEFINYISSPQKLSNPRTKRYKELIREFKYKQRRERESEQRRCKRKQKNEDA